MLDGNPVGTNTKTLQTTIPGTYSVSVTSSSGCFGIDSLTLAISEPTVELGSNKSICDNEPSPILDAGNPGSSYSWFLDGLPVGGNTQTLTTSASGTYSVILVNQYGCVASDSISITVFSSLLGAITVPSPVYVGDIATFTDNSSPGPISWIWNFGDGTNNDTNQNTTHIYSTAGIYPIFLVVGNTICYDTVATTIEVLNNCNSLGLTSSFSTGSDTIDLAGLGIAYFINTSINAISWIWEFGDGSPSSTVLDPNHTFVDTGIYTITLTSFNYNCTDSFTYDVVVINSTTLPPVDTSDTTTGINNKIISQLINLRVYPNPNDGIFIIDATLKKQKQYTIEILNILGQSIMKEIVFSSERYYRKYAIEDTNKGLYYIRIQSNEKVIIKTIIVY
jgi:PKD repeat protein